MIERIVVVMCDKKSDKTRQLSEHLFGINKDELLIQTSIWIEEEPGFEQKQSRRVSQVGAALRKF